MVPTLIQFDDNRLLPLLFGEHDKHLVRIEKSLGVQLINRGNQVTIEGPQDADRSCQDRTEPPVPTP